MRFWMSLRVAPNHAAANGGGRSRLQSARLPSFALVLWRTGVAAAELGSLGHFTRHSILEFNL